jgi:hypothetical protein
MSCVVYDLRKDQGMKIRFVKLLSCGCNCAGGVMGKGHCHSVKCGQ